MRAATVEQAPLGGEVVLHRRVEVEVVLGEVGEDRDGEVDRVGAAQLERVGGDLHGAALIPGVDHLPERGLKVDGLRGGALDLPLHPSDDRLHGAEQGAPVARGLQQRPHEEGRGRLAVGAGDPDHPQHGRRIAREAGRRAGHGLADGRDSQLGHAERERTLHDERGGTPRDGVRRVIVAVGGEAADAEEQRPGADPPVVVGQSGDLHAGGLRRRDRGLGDDLGEPHRRRPRAGLCARAPSSGECKRGDNRPLRGLQDWLRSLSQSCNAPRCHRSGRWMRRAGMVRYDGGTRRYWSAKDII